MKKILCIIFALIFTGSLTVISQECLKAGWVKPFGGTSANDRIIDAARDVNQNFIVVGTYSNNPLTLNANVLPVAGLYHVYLGRHDSAGVFSNAKRIGYCTAGSNALAISKINVGVDGSIYVTGQYNGSGVYFNDSLLPSTIRERMFVAKFDPNFQLKWKRQSDWMSAECYANDVTSDLNKNVYVTGYFKDDAFKIGSFIADNSGGYNLWSDETYILKFDSLGVTQFLRSFGTYNDDSGRTITADSSGNIIVTGVTSSTYIQFDEQHQVTCGPGSQNLYIGKFSGTDGHCIWGKMAGGYASPDMIYPYDAVLGENNSLYICGQINGLVNLYPNTYTSYDANGFISKLDANGNSLWLKVIGGQNSSEYATSLSYYNGNVAVCGALFSNQPYVGTFPLYTVLTGGGYAGFNAQFKANGQLLWARANSSTSTNFYNKCVLIDNDGNQLLWGGFKSTQNWYPITLTNSLSNFKMSLAKFLPFTASPAFTVSAGIDKATTCGVAVQLSGSTNPTTIPYGWYPDLGFSGNGTKTPNVNPGINTDYVLYGTYQGCVKSDTVKVAVTNNSLTVSAGADLGFCRGDSIQIPATSNQAGTTFSWSPNKYINTAASQSPYVKPLLTTNYVVMATNANCKAFDTVRVTANPKPYIYLAKQDLYTYWRLHLCNGSPLDLNMGDSTNSYTVLTPTMVTNVNNNHVTVLANNSGWLKVTAQSPEGCTNRDSVTVLVHNNLAPPPILNVLHDRSACPGDSVKFALTLHNSLQYTYQYGWYAGWQMDSLNGKGWQDVSIWDKNYDIFNFSVGFSTSTYYSNFTIYNVKSDMDSFKLRCYVSDYCSPRNYSNEAILTVGPKITVQPLNKLLCQGATDSINVNSSSPGLSYQWEIWQGATFVPVVNQPGVINANGRYLKFSNVQSPISGSIVRCKVNGCTPQTYTYSDTALIRVITPPVILSQSDNDTLCELINDTLKVNVSGGPYTYQWLQNGNPLGCTSQICGANTSQLRFTPVYLSQNNYTYTCRITNAQCSYTTLSTPVNFSVAAAPTVTWTGSNLSSCVSGAPVTLSGGSPAGGTYSGAGVTGNVFDPSATGTGTFVLSYNVTGANGCSNYKNRNMIVNVCTGIDETESGKLLVKQSADAVYIEHTNYFRDNFTVVLYNASGQKVTTYSFKGNCANCMIPTNDLAKGFYFIHLSDNEKSKVYKVIIQ